MKKLIGLLVVFAVAATMAYAATVNSDAGLAKAKIIQAPTLTHVTNAALDYGTVIRNSGGTVTVAAAATPSPTYSGVAPATGAVTADHFELSGLDTATHYAVSVPASVSLTGTPSGTMSSTLVLSSGANDISGAETADIYVGGVLTVGASQDLGVYSGNYTVTVTY